MLRLSLVAITTCLMVTPSSAGISKCFLRDRYEVELQLTHGPFLLQIQFQSPLHLFLAFLTIFLLPIFQPRLLDVRRESSLS